MAKRKAGSVTVNVSMLQLERRCVIELRRQAARTAQLYLGYSGDSKNCASSITLERVIAVCDEYLGDGEET